MQCVGERDVRVCEHACGQRVRGVNCARERVVGRACGAADVMAVDRTAEAAEQRDAERATELIACLGDPGGNAGPLRRGGPDDQLGPEHRPPGATPIISTTVAAITSATFVPPDPKSDSLVLLDEYLAEGDHALPLPDHIPAKAAFATVQIDTTIYALSIASEH